MKKLAAMMLALVMLCLAMPLYSFAAETAADPFQDVEYGDWYYTAVSEVRDLNLFAGTSANSFSPNATMTRGMFVTVLGKMAKINTADYPGQSFTDVKSDAYYAGYVNWAYKTGLVAGTGNGAFSPNAPVTREQACIMLYRYALAYELNLEDIDTSFSGKYSSGFSDVADLPELSQTAIYELYEATIVLGRSYLAFAPKDELTRAEAAQLFVNSYYVMYNVTETIPTEEMDVEPFFSVTIPGYWHTKVNYESEVGQYSQVKGNYWSIHFYSSYDTEPYDGLICSFIAVEDTIRYTTIFRGGDAESWVIDYRILNKVRAYDKDWLILLYIPESAQYDYDDMLENKEYTRVSSTVFDVSDTLEYADVVEILE